MTFHIYVTGINHESHLTWQAQYLVTLEGDAYCSAHCKWISYVTGINHKSHLTWQAQNLVILEGYFSWQAQYSVNFPDLPIDPSLSIRY